MRVTSYSRIPTRPLSSIRRLTTIHTPISSFDTPCPHAYSLRPFTQSSLSSTPIHSSITYISSRHFTSSAFKSYSKSNLTLPTVSDSTTTSTFSLSDVRTTTAHQPSMSLKPEIIGIEPYDTEAKWLKLEKIHWKDEEGQERMWEVANRKTRPKAGVDSCHILPLIHAPNGAINVLLIEQFRPPAGSMVIELPAGLIDEGETVEETALREMHEETGYSGPQVQVKSVSPVLVKDPGMSGANMHLVTIEVKLKPGDDDPQQHLDPGEHIIKRLVPLNQLSNTLQDYHRRGFAIDALVAAIAQGMELSRHL